jgi:CDP-diacylglycerol---glycerol-3-phosphate 3-phosphatidyltransferase
VNLPNYISLARICSIPLFIWVLFGGVFSSFNGQKELAASLVFLVASLTDGIDGYLARRRGQITTLGILLDPLADKLLITAAFIALVEFNPAVVPAWMAIIIIGREFLVSGLRSIAASEGFTIEASELGKFKMFAQIVTVLAAILSHRFAFVDIGPVVLPITLIAHVSLWFMVGLSLFSATDYFMAFWARVDRSAIRRQRRRSFVLSRRRKRDAATT